MLAFKSYSNLSVKLYFYFQYWSLMSHINSIRKILPQIYFVEVGTEVIIEVRCSLTTPWPLPSLKYYKQLWEESIAFNYLKSWISWAPLFNVNSPPTLLAPLYKVMLFSSSLLRLLFLSSLLSTHTPSIKCCTQTGH